MKPLLALVFTALVALSGIGSIEAYAGDRGPQVRDHRRGADRPSRPNPRPGVATRRAPGGVVITPDCTRGRC